MAQQHNVISTRLVEVVVVAILFLGVVAIAFWQFNTSFEVQDANSGGPFDNAAMFPRLVARGLLALGILQIGRIVLDMWLRPHQDHQVDGGLIAPKPGDETLAKLTLRALGCAFVFVVYLVLLTPVGYLAATPVLIATMAMLLGARWWMAALVSLAATLLIGFVFATILNVVLPVGRLGLPTLF